MEKLEIGKGDCKGTDAAVIAVGTMVEMAKAREELAKEISI
jgi:hypothetical protein